MGLKERIKSNPKLKKWIHWLLIPTGEARPRVWVKWLINPFVHQRGKGSKIRSRTRMDVVPFNRFELGEGSTIEDFATVNNGVGDVRIGKNTLIGMGNVLIGPIDIGNHVIFAQNIVASALNHHYEDPHLPIMLQEVRTAPIVIEDDCWIAANAVITAGVTIGKHSVVGAGSVVTKSVPPFSVVVGNPAKIIKQYHHGTHQWEKTNP